jgi:hypothetical protein
MGEFIKAVSVRDCIKSRQVVTTRFRNVGSNMVRIKGRKIILFPIVLTKACTAHCRPLIWLSHVVS